jgi:hypothetical protein
MVYGQQNIKKHILYFIHMFFNNLSYMFQCVHHPQGELFILAQNCHLCARLLHKVCYKV